MDFSYNKNELCRRRRRCCCCRCVIKVYVTLICERGIRKTTMPYTYMYMNITIQSAMKLMPFYYYWLPFHHANNRLTCSSVIYNPFRRQYEFVKFSCLLQVSLLHSPHQKYKFLIDIAVYCISNCYLLFSLIRDTNSSCIICHLLHNPLFLPSNYKN